MSVERASNTVSISDALMTCASHTANETHNIAISDRLHTSTPESSRLAAAAAAADDDDDDDDDDDLMLMQN